MSAPIYPTVLFDLDHTLFDTDQSEALAFEHTLRGVGVGDPSEHFATYDRINKALWAAVERQETTPTAVRTARFEQFVAAAGLDADPLKMADEFASGLARFGPLYPGAIELLDALAGRVALGLITNGLSEVQRGRIDRLGISSHFDAVVISAEVGASKPAPTIFDVAFGLLGSPSPASTLMVGDSLSSDIRGGADYGTATCWYNPHRKPPVAEPRVDHDVDALHRVADIVLG